MAKHKRVFGSGKTGGLELLGPRDLAQAVIGSFIDKAEEDLNQWKNDYEKKIQDYLNNAQKQRLAEAKLMTWYEVLADNRGAIAEAYDRMKNEYKNRLKALNVRIVTQKAEERMAYAPQPE